MDKNNLDKVIKKHDEKSMTDKSTTEKSTTDKSAADKSAADKSAADKPVSSHKPKRAGKHDSSLKKTGVPLFAVAIVVGLLAVSLWVFFKYSRYSTDVMIAQDMQTLQKIFKEIDKDCKIIDFEHIKNYVDFLTVKEFIGSQVGAMNITYPKNWKGPYLQHNLTVHEQQYFVLKNKQGYYLVPGDGIVLANGQTIGTDIILNEKSDIEALLQDPQSLKSSQGLLAVKIDIGGTYFKKALQDPLNYMTLEG